MLKASFNLLNGTSVTIEGTDTEGTREAIKNILDYYSQFSPAVSSHAIKPKPKVNGNIKSSKTQVESSDSSKISPDTLNQIVNLTKSCPEAEAVEKNILNKQPSEAHRVMLPLYIVHEYLKNAFGLTTVEISIVSTELGQRAKITRQNALRALTGSASKYFSANKMRKKGIATRYTLNDRGVQYMKSVLEKESTKK